MAESQQHLSFSLDFTRPQAPQVPVFEAAWTISDEALETELRGRELLADVDDAEITSCFAGSIERYAEYQIRPQGNFNRWMGEILDTILSEAHDSWPKLAATSRAESMANPPSSPIGYLAAKILASITPSQDDRNGLANLLLETIRPEVKTWYGKEAWSFDDAKMVAQEQEEVEMDTTCICVYGYHLASTTDEENHRDTSNDQFDVDDFIASVVNFIKADESEGIDANEELDETTGEDFYVGQSLVSFEERTAQHDILLSKSLEELRQKYTGRIPVFYKRGHTRSIQQRRKFVLADMSAFANNVTLASLYASTLEAAGCMFSRTFTKNDFDNSQALPFALAARPDYMPQPTWEGLNHAFPLKQPLQLNVWRKAELEIVKLPLHATNVTHINQIIQQKLAEKGFDRSIMSIMNKRKQMGLTSMFDDARKLHNIANDIWGLVEHSLTTQTKECSVHSHAQYRPRRSWMP